MKATGRALFGVALCAAATFGYFAWWAKQPGFGAHEWPLWLVQVLGIAVAGRAVLRPPPAILRADRFIAALCFVLALGVAGLFFLFTRDAMYQLPPAVAAQLAPGRTLPALARTAADGSAFDLSAEQANGRLAGKKVVLAFFRGFW